MLVGVVAVANRYTYSKVFKTYLAQIVLTLKLGYNKHMNKYNLPEAACLLTVRPDEKIACVTRRGKSTIGLGGGKVDPGETAAEAAARENNEELGLAVDPANLIELYVDVCEPETPGGQAYYCTTYLNLVPQDTELKQMEPGIRPGWFTRVELIEQGTFKEYNQNVLKAYDAYVNSVSPGM